MSSRLISSRASLALVFGVLVLGSVFGGTAWGAVTSAGREVVLWTVWPVSQPLHLLATAARPPTYRPPTPHEADEREAIIEWQEATIQRLQEQLQDVTAQHEELSGLSGLVDFTRTTLLPASVTASRPDPRRPMLTIDAGTRSGVTQGQAVVTLNRIGPQLVGQVVDARATTSDVLLLTRPGATVQADLLAPDPGEVPRSYAAQLQPLGGTNSGGGFYADPPLTHDVRVGDVARLTDDLWPREARWMIVGRVTEVWNGIEGVPKHPTNPLALQRVIIRPAVDLGGVRRVQVLIPR